MTPDEIKPIQAFLKAQGLYTLEVDGVWGPESRKAWAKFTEAPKTPAAANAPSNIVQQLRRDEGEVLHVYKDHLGYDTLGVGRLVDARKGGGISEAESAYLLGNDIAKVTTQIQQRLPWAVNLTDARRGVLVNMAFQMGIDGLLGFKNTLAMIQAGQYTQAADAMLQSLWSQQTPARAKRLSDQMRTSVWN